MFLSFSEKEKGTHFTLRKIKKLYLNLDPSQAIKLRTFKLLLGLCNLHTALSLSLGVLLVTNPFCGFPLENHFFLLQCPLLPLPFLLDLITPLAYFLLRFLSQLACSLCSSTPSLLLLQQSTSMIILLCNSWSCAQFFFSAVFQVGLNYITNCFSAVSPKKYYVTIKENVLLSPNALFFFLKIILPNKLVARILTRYVVQHDT